MRMMMKLCLWRLQNKFVMLVSLIRALIGENSQYRIRDHIKQRQTEYKEALLYTRNMGKGLHKVFKASVNDILQVLPILGESG